MKILHTSDLHIGKHANEYSMIEDQKHILKQIVQIARDEQVDAVILAGDIYDRSLPPAEAVSLFDDFLVDLAGLGKPLFIISGNHDSAERIAFASRIMQECKVYLSPVYNGCVEPVVLNDGTTEVAFYLLPFIKPATVRYYAEKLHEGEDGEKVDIKSYDEAVRFAIGQMDVDPSRRNVIVTHQFITGANRTDSEDNIGGLDNIDASVFDQFDYVALGHLHRPQFCGRETVRYSGTPLKYSFSEVNDEKSVTIVEINGTEAPVITEHPLTPLRDWYDLRGTYAELTEKSFYDGKGYQEGYVRITLTDKTDIPDGLRKLRCIYHRIAEFGYENRMPNGSSSVGAPTNITELKPGELFAELFKRQNGEDMSDEQRAYLNDIIDSIFNQH